ncbi:MAG TPA: DsrE/DsrF/DrsH-like family protein [Acetobacteraceae bacterium]
MPSDTLGILLISGTHERAHYAFVLASGAAAIGRDVVLFATNEGCRALLADWSSLDDPGRDARIRAHGVAGLAELRDAAAELGVRLIVCEAGLHMSGLTTAPLAEKVQVAGVATFLESTKTGQIVTL